MTHADIVAAIERHGGRLVASFTLDADGSTLGARRDGNRPAHCSECGAPGHTNRRCRGAGNPPKLTHAERRRAGADWLRATAQGTEDKLAETKAILAARAEERRATRRR